MEKEFDLVGAIIDYESGDLNDRDSLELFCHLIKTGQCWSLQGHYGRTATQLIEGGYINCSGDLTEIGMQV
jgi:hypothetical protein